MGVIWELVVSPVYLCLRARGAFGACAVRPSCSRSRSRATTVSLLMSEVTPAVTRSGLATTPRSKGGHAMSPAGLAKLQALQEQIEEEEAEAAAAAEAAADAAALADTSTAAEAASAVSQGDVVRGRWRPRLRAHQRALGGLPCRRQGQRGSGCAHQRPGRRAHARRL